MEKKQIAKTPKTTIKAKGAIPVQYAPGETPPPLPELPPKKQKGGKQEGAGRPKGTKNLLTVSKLLEEVEKQSGGKPYEELLIQDFLVARTRDLNLTVKYHQLILQKVMSTVASVEVTRPEEEVEAKQQAFNEALAKLVGINKE